MRRLSSDDLARLRAAMAAMSAALTKLAEAMSEWARQVTESPAMKALLARFERRRRRAARSTQTVRFFDRKGRAHWRPMRQ